MLNFREAPGYGNGQNWKEQVELYILALGPFFGAKQLHPLRDYGFTLCQKEEEDFLLIEDSSVISELCMLEIPELWTTEKPAEKWKPKSLVRISCCSARKEGISGILASNLESIPLE